MNRLLTVLMPTLNAGAYLEQALASLAEQTFQDFELLIVDAGSTDGTLELLRKPPVRTTILSCGRIGLGGQLKLGLEKIDTKYVARMDADDISLPQRFERQIDVLEARPEVTILGSQICLLAKDRVCRAAELPAHQAAIRAALLAGFPAFSHPTVMFRAQAANRSNAYSIAGSGEDLDFYLRMTEAGVGENLPAVLHQYRIHERSVSFRIFDEVQRNYAYAVACAVARADGLREPTVADFSSNWMRRPLNARLLSRLECLGTRLYRRSRIRIAQGHRITGVAGALASVLIRPGLVRTRARIRWAAWRQAA
jgi:glycosyltransferase involved in cell wall biosynthesis